MHAIQRNSPPRALRPNDDPKAAEIHVHGSPRYITALCDSDAPEREELEQFVRAVFYRAHGATLRHFMPQLVSLRDGNGHLLAVCGLRNAGRETLFLETYLDAPVETLIAAQFGRDVARAEVVEIGNLAVAEPGVAPLLFAAVNHNLHSTGALWGVFTAVPLLRNSLARLNMQPRVLAEARLECIAPHERHEWGSYYDKNPLVMAARRASRPGVLAD
ncbi:MAG: thermostable hemolysin [Methylobacillus sp.]|jgi:hypothetical protein|nr:thermostable hemolysin [Methylobacillus sp.]